MIIDIDDKYHGASRMHASLTILIQTVCYSPLAAGNESADLFE